MKKLLLGAILTIGYAFGANAQVTLCSTNFPNAVIPLNWTQQLSASDPTNKGWQFSNAVLPANGYLANYYMPASGTGDFAFVNDVDNNSAAQTNFDTLYTNVFSCASYSHVYISFNIWYQGYYDPNNNDAENVTVAVSTDGGHTWTTAITNPYGTWNSVVTDISSFVANQSNVKVAFTYTDGGAQLIGMGLDNVSIYSPANYDVAVISQNTPPIMHVGNSYTFSGAAADSGYDAITSMDLNYSVNGGPAQTQSFPGIAGFNTLTATNWTMNTVPFVPAAAGVYTVKYWASNLNGLYPNVNTDTLVVKFLAMDTLIPRQSLYEEQTGQSCVFCMIAAPNMDSVYDNNAKTSNIIRYHVPIPNRDLMYNANETPINARESYYGITGAPWGDLDGTYMYPSTYQQNDPTMRYSSSTIQADNAIDAPFKINITSSEYIASKDSFYVSATITAYAAFPAGLTAQVALTIDSLTYQYDLSTDDPKQEFAPPVGTSAAGFSYQGAPDYLYDYVLKFTHVCEEMFPNTGAGSSLGAFAAGQSQTIKFGWKKSHQWGAYYSDTAHQKQGAPLNAYRDSDFYDSSSTGQFVVFIQADNGVTSEGIPAQYVFQSASAPITGITDLGVEGIANSATPFRMYPNPTNNNTTLAFNLTQDQNVNVEVYNMLGEQVYANNEGILSTGQHTININGSALQSGLYLVRFITDGGTTTQKLLIQR